MASGQTVNKLTTRVAATMYRTTSASSATDVAWVDMSGYHSILVGVVASTLVGNGVTAFKLIANTSSTGGGTDREIVAHAVGSAPDAVGDYLWLEATAEQIADLGARNGEALRYVSANITCANASDVVATVYIRTPALWSHDDLTADYVS